MKCLTAKAAVDLTVKGKLKRRERERERKGSDEMKKEKIDGREVRG